MAIKTLAAVTHPGSKRKMKIDAAIYEPFKAAILQSLKGSPGKTYTELNDSVTGIIRKKIPGFGGSVSWYTITVRLDLEAKGIVETFTQKGKKMNRLVK
jgi:hypothetical protein